MVEYPNCVIAYTRDGRWLLLHALAECYANEMAGEPLEDMMLRTFTPPAPGVYHATLEFVWTAWANDDGDCELTGITIGECVLRFPDALVGEEG